MSIKEQRKNEIKQNRSKKYKTLIKNQFKKIDSCLKSKTEGSRDELKTLVSMAQCILDKASNKKIIHKNKAARRKSRLFKLISSSKDKIGG